MSEHVSSCTPDEAAAMTLVESVVTCIDRHDFETLEDLYADNVVRDYTSLNGGEPEVTTNKALMMRWARHLPGFDRTRHTLSGMTANVDGDTARVEADVVADHWIDDLLWTVSGRHIYELGRFGRDWRVTGQTFVFHAEHGGRDAAKRAGAAAAANPNAYVLRQQTRDAVMQLLTGFETRDMDRINAVWAEHAVQEMPYAPEGVSKRIVGREALIANYAPFPTKCERASMTAGIQFYDTRDPATVIVEYEGNVKWFGKDEPYIQPYIAIFRVKDGKIELFRQYYDSCKFANMAGRKTEN